MDYSVSHYDIDAIFLLPHYPKKDGIVGLGGFFSKEKMCLFSTSK